MQTNILGFDPTAYDDWTIAFPALASRIFDRFLVHINVIYLKELVNMVVSESLNIACTDADISSVQPRIIALWIREQYPYRYAKTIIIKFVSLAEFAVLRNKIKPNVMTSVGKPALSNSHTPEKVADISQTKLPDNSLEVVPKSSPEVVPKSSPEVVPKSSPEVVPKSSPEVVPKSSPEVVPKSSPEVVPKSSPEVVPKALQK